MWRIAPDLSALVFNAALFEFSNRALSRSPVDRDSCVRFALTFLRFRRWDRRIRTIGQRRVITASSNWTLAANLGANRVQLQLVMPQVRESRDYEDNSYGSTNGSAQPFGHWLFVWPWPTHEGRIECVRSEAEYNGHNSHNYLENASCQGCLLARS